MTEKQPSVLIVDDEQAICELLSDILGGQGYACTTANSVAEAEAVLKDHEFDLALLDIKMPGASGMDLLETMWQSYRNTAVIMITAVSDTNTAIEAMKRGALDYIMKPFTVQEVRARVGKVLRDRAMRSEKNLNNAPQDAPNLSQTQKKLDALAHGVEAQVSQFDLHTKIVIEKTIQVARQIGLDEKEINEWASRQRDLSLVKEKQMEWAAGTFELQAKNEVGPSPDKPRP